jgi:hypothetical protein
MDLKGAEMDLKGTSLPARAKGEVFENRRGEV